MADPRYKNGVFQGNPVHHRRLGLTADLDTPLLHGWTHVRQVDGYSVFALEAHGHRVEMRATMPAEKAESGHDWVALVGGTYWGFSGSLARITEEIKDMLQAAERSEP